MTRLACLVLATLAAATASAAPAPTAAWSATVSGLRGRLIATPFQDAQHRAQVKLELELENVSDSAEPMAIAVGLFPGVVELAVEDAAGKPLPEDHPGGNEIALPPYALRLPQASTLRATLSSSAFEYLTTGIAWLRPFAFKAWTIPAKRGPLFLRATFKPVESDVAGPRAWNGALALPRVALP